MDDDHLQQWTERISLEFFKRPFKHRATFNQRLRSTGGRYLMRTHDIEISWHQYELNGAEEVEKIIKHELCHYHLHLQKQGYRHGDLAFKVLLQQVGGSRYCKPLPDYLRRKEPYRYKLVCSVCHTEYFRKRKMNPSQYVCGVCQSKLELFELT